MNILKNRFWAFLLLFTLVGCETEEAPEIKELELPVVELTTFDTAFEKLYVADIHAVKNVEIRNRVAGFIEEIYVDEGKRVEKNQPLFLINAQEYKAALASAKANLQNAIAEAKSAELEVNRVKTLVEKEVVSPTEFEMAKAKWNAANAKIDEAKALQAMAEIRLNATKITAPFAGVLDRIPLKVGSLLQEGSLLTTVSDLEHIYAYFAVSESEYLTFKKERASNNVYAQELTLILADGTVYPHKGQIETIEGEFDNSTGSISFRAKFPNPEYLLKHGSTGKVVLPKKMKNVLLVPQKAVLEIQDQLYVYVVKEDGSLQMKSFKSAAKLDRIFVCEKGLEKGEKIVYEGIQGLDTKLNRVKGKPVSWSDILKPS